MAGTRPRHLAAHAGVDDPLEAGVALHVQLLAVRAPVRVPLVGVEIIGKVNAVVLEPRAEPAGIVVGRRIVVVALRVVVLRELDAVAGRKVKEGDTRGSIRDSLGGGGGGRDVPAGEPVEEILDDADGGGDPRGVHRGPLRELDGLRDGGEVDDDAVDGRLVVVHARVSVLGNLLRVEADVAPAVDGEVVQEEPRGAALVEERGGLLEERVHGDGVFESLEGVSLGRLEGVNGPMRPFLRGALAVAVQALAVTLGAGAVLLVLVLRHLVHASEHLERLVVERVDARGVDLDPRVEGARRLLKVGLAVFILRVADNLADVVDEREGPGVLGVDLVLARQLDAVAVQVEDALGAQRRLLGLRRVDGGHPGQRFFGGPFGGHRVVGIVEGIGERPAVVGAIGGGETSLGFGAGDVWVRYDAFIAFTRARLGLDARGTWTINSVSTSDAPPRHLGRLPRELVALLLALIVVGREQTHGRGRRGLERRLALGLALAHGRRVVQLA